jgi:hypothetical protein
MYLLKGKRRSPKGFSEIVWEEIKYILCQISAAIERNEIVVKKCKEK